MITKKQLKHIVTTYWQLKEIISAYSDGDLNSGKHLRENMTIEDMENYYNVVKHCEDLGINLVVKRAD